MHTKLFGLACDPQVRRAARAGLSVVAMIVVVGSCKVDAVAPVPSTDISQLFWTLELNHRAVNLSTVAPYDTIRLVATPRNAAGEPLTGFPPPSFKSSDLDRVQVDSDGVVHAIRAGTKLTVVATLSVGNLTHTATAVVNVRSLATPPVLDSLSIQPLPGDSAKWAFSTAFAGNKTLAARATDVDGNPITGLAVYYASSDPTTATIDSTTGLITPVRMGRVTFYASTTAYGVTKADSLPFRIGLPLNGGPQITRQWDSAGNARYVFDTPVWTLGVGAIVGWLNRTGIPTDITFDDPTHIVQVDLLCAAFAFFCGEGNIEPFGPPPGDPNFWVYSRFRYFPTPGTYTYRSTTFNVTGKIVIVDESAQ